MLDESRRQRPFKAKAAKDWATLVHASLQRKMNASNNTLSCFGRARHTIASTPGRAAPT